MNLNEIFKYRNLPILMVHLLNTGNFKRKLNASQIARKLNLSPCVCNKLILIMEKYKLITLVKIDERSATPILTENGRQIAIKLFELQEILK